MFAKKILYYDYGKGLIYVAKYLCFSKERIQIPVYRSVTPFTEHTSVSKVKKLFYVLVVAHEYNLNFGDLEQVMRRVPLIKNRSFISGHITEALKSLHWLHFKFGTDFKSLLTTYKGPSWFWGLYIRTLRSVNVKLLLVPKSGLNKHREERGPLAVMLFGMLAQSNLSNQNLKSTFALALSQIDWPMTF